MLGSLFFTLLLTILLFGSFVVFLSQGNFTAKKVGIMLFQLISISALLYILWPFYIPQTESKKKVAENFLIALGHSDKAELRNLMPSSVTNLGIHDLSFAYEITLPKNHPTSWEINDPNSKNIIHGPITMSDGFSGQYLIKLGWDWGNARWGVERFEISPSRDRLQIDSSSRPQSQFPYFSFWGFRLRVNIFSLLTLIVSFRHFPKLQEFIAN